MSRINTIKCDGCGKELPHHGLSITNLNINSMGYLAMPSSSGVNKNYDFCSTECLAKIVTTLKYKTNDELH